MTFLSKIKEFKVQMGNIGILKNQPKFVHYLHLAGVYFTYFNNIKIILK
jgi:hypothetical protein